MHMEEACWNLKINIIGLVKQEQMEEKNTGKVSVYSSADLYNWHNEGIALDLSSKLAMIAVERPKVIYNKKNKEFVMWFHEELGGKYNTGKAGIAVAKNHRTLCFV